MNWINAIWILAFPAIMLFEGWAAGDAVEGNTISENAWKLRSVVVGRYFLWMGLMWMNWHILLETVGSGVGWQDGVAVGVGFVGATWRTYRGKDGV